MTTGAVTLLLWLVVVLALINALFQLIDLHTTAEAIKRRVGHETNEYLAPYLNTGEPFARVFWRLVVVKLVAIVAGSVGPLVAGRLLPPEPGYLLIIVAAQVYLMAYYFPILLANWRVYKKTEEQ